jgi:hypothetical protein
MAEDNDILAMIAALEAKRSALDNAIASLRVLAGQAAPEGTELPSALTRSDGTDVRSDTFHGLSMPEAVKKYLRIKKGPQNARAIAAVLPRGGFKSKAKNLYPNVYTALLRLQEAGEAEKLASGEWGLSEWYRGTARKEPKPKRPAERENGGAEDSATDAAAQQQQP